MNVSVAIPTYKRPEYLRRAYLSVINQTRKPNEIILISRSDDLATNEMIALLIADQNGKVITKNLLVSESGFLPPVICAINEAEGDILALLDDDAEAHPDWLEKIVSYYNNPSVGGVGGRCINYFSGVLQNYPPAKRVGQLSWYGRSVGNMYRDCEFTGAVEVEFLMGGNMSYRLALLRQCKPDKRIGNNVAFHWELDVGQQVKRLGYQIIFDPSIKIDHHTAPREIDGMRTVNYEGVYWSNYNYTLLMRKHLSLPGFISYLIYGFLIGASGSPGFVYYIYALMRGRHVAWRESVLASIFGRLSGMKA